MSSEPGHPEAAAELVLDHCLGRPPTLGLGRLVCIDGPAGSGKTTLAEAVVAASRRRVPSVRLLHMDDLYEGWDGLPGVGARVRDDILAPLGRGLPGHYRRWDWRANGWAEPRLVDPASLVVVEGVGSGSREYADTIGTLVWVEAPTDVRVARGIERDGEALRELWLRWLDSEADHFALHRTSERADILVDGTGALAARLVG